jgi:hypothetical protein
LKLPGHKQHVFSVPKLVLLQVFHLQEADIGCAYVSSGMDWMEQRNSFDRVRSCGSQETIVLFVTPEKVTLRLLSPTPCACDCCHNCAQQLAMCTVP